MKTELKNCLSLYKIFYSCAFILILCVIHPIIYYEEIGSAIQSPIAFLTIIFCSDTSVSYTHLQKLLRVLCENRGKVLKREYLIDEVWQGDTELSLIHI